MKEAQDLLRELLSTLSEVADLVEDMTDFEHKSDVIATIDSCWNEISYQLSELS